MNAWFKIIIMTSTASVLLGCGEGPVEKARTDDQAEQAQPNEPPVQIQVGVDAQTPETKPAPKPFQTDQAVRPERTKPVAVPTPRARSPFPVRRCINLGNALEAEHEGAWGYTIRNRDIATIARAGFDSIRLPVRWDLRAAKRAPYTIDPAYMRRVRQVIDHAQANGLTVIVDVHHYEDLMTRTARETPRFLAIWDQIATALKDEPYAGQGSVVFEALNEPTLDISMPKVNALYAKLLPIIRKTNPNRKLILGGNSWNSVANLEAVKWPSDPNIVATYHDYGPHEFTHQGAEWMEPKMPLGRRWGGQADQMEMRDTFAKARAFQSRTNLPVLVGEFGVINKVNDVERAKWIKARRKTMEAQGLSWCVWDFSGAFSLYDMNTERWKPGMMDALFGR